MLDRQNIPRFDPSRYENLPMNELVVYAVHYLDNLDLQISHENITACAFLLFPKVFQLHGYSEWPDSARVNKRWLDCRSLGYITGNTANDFKLTPKGYELAAATGERLTGKRPIFRSKAETHQVRTHTRSGKFVKLIEQSDAYRIYKESGRVDRISEYDFRSMLMCTMETTARVLRGNLEQYKQHVSDHEREDMGQMLDKLEMKFQGLLQPQSDSKYEGGMFRKKSNRGKN